MGNVGRIEGKFLWPLIGAYSYLLLRAIDVDSLMTAAFASATFFDWKSAKWRETTKKQKCFWRYIKNSFTRISLRDYCL